MEKSITFLSSMTDKALEDGIITRDERAILKSVFDDLKGYNWFLQDALDDGIIDFSEEERLKNLLCRIFENALKAALDDNVITDDEKALLDHLGRSLCIDDVLRKSIQNMIEEEKSEVSINLED